MKVKKTNREKVLHVINFSVRVNCYSPSQLTILKKL